jgi:hypothetical protein
MTRSTSPSPERNMNLERTISISALRLLKKYTLETSEFGVLNILEQRDLMNHLIKTTPSISKKMGISVKKE